MFFVLIVQLELGINVRMVIIGNVLSIQDLGYGIKAPLGIDRVVLFVVTVGILDTWAVIFPHELTGRLLFVGPWTVETPPLSIISSSLLTGVSSTSSSESCLLERNQPWTY